MSKAEFRAEMERIGMNEKIYNIWDENNDGRVTRDEMKRKTKLGQTQIKHAIASVDADEDSALSKQEFHDMLNRKRLGEFKRTRKGRRHYEEALRSQKSK